MGINLFGQGMRSVIEKRKRVRHIPIVHPHAILDSDGRVLVVRQYPRAARSNAVVPIPDDGPMPRPGWYWTGKKFQKEKPE